jgi:hypothetical protein
MRLPWFARAYRRWAAWKGALLAQLRASWAWRAGHLLRLRAGRQWARWRGT